MSHERSGETPVLDGTLFGAGQPCFGCGPTHPTGFRLAFERTESGVQTCFTPGAAYQGPPGVMHGGLVTTLADEIAAWVIIGLYGKFGFTAHIDARLKKALRIGVEVVGTGRIVRDGTRVVKVGVELVQAGESAFEGVFTFALVNQAGAERLLGMPLPEAYRRFALEI